MNKPTLDDFKQIVRRAQAQGYVFNHRVWGVGEERAEDGKVRWLKTEGNNEIHPIGFVILGYQAKTTLLRTFAAVMGVDLVWTVGFMDGFDHNTHNTLTPRDAYDLGVQLREYVEITASQNHGDVLQSYCD